MSKFLKYHFHKFSDNHGKNISRQQKIPPPPQNNVVSRIKNVGQHCNGGWGNLVHFLGTFPIIFSPIVEFVTFSSKFDFDFSAFDRLVQYLE